MGACLGNAQDPAKVSITPWWTVSRLRQSLSSARLVLAVGSVFITLLLVVAAATIYVQRQQSIDLARANLTNLSRLLAEHARQSNAAAD